MPRPNPVAGARRAAVPLRLGMILAGAIVLTYGVRGLLRIDVADPGPGPAVRPVADFAPPRAVTAARPGSTTEASAVRDEAARDVIPSDGGPSRRWYDGRPIRPVRHLRMRVTAYSPDERSCAPYADGRTASGYSVWTNGMKLAAADTRLLPFGTLLSVPGYDGGSVIPVLDRGGRIRGHRLDVLFPTHRAARGWGVQELDVTVWAYDDGGDATFTRPR